MRRKDEPDMLKRKQTQKEQTFEYSCDTQIMILIPYLKMMSSSMQARFLMALRQVVDKQPVSETLRSFVHKTHSPTRIDHFDSTNNFSFLEIVCRFLKLNRLREAFTNLPRRNSSQEKQVHDKQDLSISNLPFQPNIQKQGDKLEPIPQVINPNYQNLIKMYRVFTDVHINSEYKIKQLNETYSFFSQPRFVSKLLEMHDFESDFAERGNIVMMNFQGNKIAGKRGFAFSNKNVIYWWEKNYKDVKDILPESAEDKDRGDKVKDGRKKQSEREEEKNVQPNEPKFNQNFKLVYKMVGHHGKITGLSLSDDEYYLLSAGTDKLIKLWCLRQKCLLAEYRGHNKVIWSIGFSKSGYFFLSGSADKTIKLWSTDDSIPQRVFLGHLEDVVKVDFLMNPDLIASGSVDKTVRIWNALTAQCISILNFTQPVCNFKSSISGRFFVVCDCTGAITLYDLLKGELISYFKVPEKQESQSGSPKYLKVHDMCFSMDEKQFACVSSKYIIIYSLDKICQKQSKSIFSENNKDSREKGVATKEVIYTGRDSNIVYCEYHDKGVLLVASTSIKKY